MDKTPKILPHMEDEMRYDKVEVIKLRGMMTTLRDENINLRAEIAALKAELSELRTPLKDWDVKLAEKNAALIKRNQRIGELEAALSGRTVSCVCGGLARAEAAEAKLAGAIEESAARLEVIYMKDERMAEYEAHLAALLPVLEGAKGVDARCPEGFDGQDNWTNEAHRILNVALAAYAARYPDQKGETK